MPDHLKLTFRGWTTSTRRWRKADLEALKESLRGKVQETLSRGGR